MRVTLSAGVSGVGSILNRSLKKCAFALSMILRRRYVEPIAFRRAQISHQMCRVFEEGDAPPDNQM
jgi:hypothetical protein